MDDNQMVARIRELYEFGDMQEYGKAMEELASEDIVQEWPQSGERIRGKGNIAKMNEGYSSNTGTTPKATLRRVLKPGEAWIIEGTIDYGDGTPVSSVAIIELGADGKIVRETDYFANPFEAPAWRSQFVERMEPVGSR
ncbi:MAG: YbbC/YhhH family protein [Chloroflexota bacterium]|nr:YbbC/YhhH family protein [Chloroflexota bacterium]